MADNRIDIIVNIAAQGDAYKRLQDFNAELRSIPAQAAQVSASLDQEISRRGEYAGRRGVENKLAILSAREAELPTLIQQVRQQVTSEYIQTSTVPVSTPIQQVIERNVGLARPDILDAPPSWNDTRAAFSEKSMQEARRTIPAYASLAEGDELEKTKNLEAQITAIKAAEQQKRTTKAEQEAQKRANFEERAINRANVIGIKEVDKEVTTQKRQQEAIGNAAIRGAAERERAEQIVYAQAQQDNRLRDQQLHRGYFSVAEGDPEQIYGDTHQQEIISRMPTRRQAQAFYGELAAEEVTRNQTGFGKFFSNINRQGGLEAQAAIINTVQALASGMNPLHVAMMESTQLGGAAVQGGLISLQQILTALVSPVGALTAAFLGVAGGLASIIHQIYEVNSAIRATQGSLQIQGLGREGIASTTGLREERTQLQQRFNFFDNNQTSSLTSSLDNAAPSVQKFRKEIFDLETAYAAVKRIDLSDSGKLFGKAAEGGAEGFRQLAESMNVGDANWHEHIKTLIASKDETNATGEVIGALKGRFGEAGLAAASATDWWETYKSALAAGPSEFLRYKLTGFGPVDTTKLGEQVPEATREGVGVAAKLTPEVFDRSVIQGRYNKLLETELQLSQQIKAIEASGGHADEGSVKSVERIREAIRNTAEAEEPKGVAEENQYRVRLAELDRQIADADAEAQARPEAREQVLSLQRQRLVMVSENAQNQFTRTGDIPSRVTPDIVQQEAQTEQTQRTIQRETLEKQLFQIQQTQTEQRFNPTAQREAAEQRLSAIQESAARTRTGNIQEERSAELALIQAKQQEVQASENVNTTSIQQQGILAETRGDLEEILRTHQRINQVIQNSNVRSPLEQAQSTLSLRRIETQVQTRQLSREMAVSELGRAQNPNDLTGNRISLENDLNTLLRSGLSTEEQRLQKLGEIVRARQAEIAEAEHLQILELNENEMLAQSRGQLDQVVALRKTAAEIIKANPLNSDATKKQADIAVTQSELASYEKSIQLQQKIVDLQNRASTSRLDTQRMALNVDVEQGTTSRQDAIRTEAVLTQRTMVEQEQRVQATINSLSDDQYEKKAELFSKLGELYEQDAQKQLQLQIELTRAVEAENAKRTKHIHDFLKATESGIEDALAGALSGKKTLAEGLRDLRTSMISSATKAVTGMLSEAAGKSIAGSLGVKLKEGEDSSISNVLTKALGNAFGLTKEAPKTDVERIRGLTEKATNAQQEAAKLLSEAARDLKNAAGAIGQRQINTNAPASTLKESPTVDNSGRIRSGVVEQARQSGPQLTSDQTVAETDNAIVSSKKLSTSEMPSDVGGQVAATLRNRGWSDSAIQGALNNAMTESSLNPNATGAAGEKGLFQFHPKSHIGPFEQQSGGDWSPQAQTEYVAKVVEKSIPGYTQSTDPRQATADFLRGFEKPADQSDTQLNTRFANNAASQEIVQHVSSLSTQKQIQQAQVNEPVSGDFGGGGAARPNQIVGFGDSIAAHLVRKADADGQESGKVGVFNPGDTAVSGYSPKQVLEIINKAPEERIRGRDIALSSGTSNDPQNTQSEYIGQQIDALKGRGAASVTLMGVGNKDFLAGRNEQLERIAIEKEVNFSGPLRSIGSDQIHSSNPAMELAAVREAATPGTIHYSGTEQRTVGDLLQQAAPRYKEITDGEDISADFQKSWGHPFQEMSTARRIQSALGDEQLKPIALQANSAIQAVHPGLDVESAFKAGKPSLDELLKLPVQGDQTQRQEQAIRQGMESASSQIQSSIQTGVQQANNSLIQGNQQTQSSVSQNNSETQQNTSQLQTLNQNIQQISQKRETTGEQSNSTQTGSQTTQANSQTTQTNNQQDNSQSNVVQQTNSSLSQLQTSANSASNSLMTTGQSASMAAPLFEVAGSSASTVGTGLGTVGSSATQTGSQLDQAGQSAAQAGQQFAQAGQSATSGTGGTGGAGGDAKGGSGGSGGLLSGVGELASVATAFSALTGAKVSPMVSKITAGVSLLSSVFKMFSGGGLLGGLTGGSGGNGGSGGSAFGGIGSIFSGITSLFGLFALEGGGVIPAIPSSAGGNIVPFIMSSENGNIVSSVMSSENGNVVPFIPSAKDGVVIPSAAGGFHVQETSLSSSIRTGINNLAKSGQASMFRSSQYVSHNAGSLGISDGKGGRVGIFHPGEMIVPAAETRMILGAMNDNVSQAQVVSAAGGFIAGNVSMPRVTLPARPSSGLRVIDGGRGTDGRDGSNSNSSTPSTQNIHHETTNINLNSIDSRSGAKFVMDNADAVVKAVAMKRRNFDGRGR